MATQVQFGLTLPNRMVVVGMGTMGDIISLGVDAEESGLFQSLWVGDSILAKRRPESIALLCALAAVTKKVRLAPGCMASFPIRNIFTLAAQWATLDHIDWHVRSVRRPMNKIARRAYGKGSPQK